ncbi:hypothetical protein BS78_06G078100 [Paspalum vaginatum]|nr:hypothetical protein BS78_06G078100 [Paspalum vaginatum]
MPTVAVTLDLACCRCRSKIEKILCWIQERCGFVFEKVVYEKDKVLISGPFDAVELCCKLRCKAHCLACKIEIPPPEKCTTLILCPYPYPYPCPYPYPQPLACPPNCPKPPRSCECPSCCGPPRPCLPPPCPPHHPCPPPPPGCRQCPPWTPCKCPGYPLVVCSEENYPPNCTVM